MSTNPTPTNATAAHPWAGKFFYAIKDGDLQWQGRVDAITPDNGCLFVTVMESTGVDPGPYVIEVKDAAFRSKRDHWAFFGSAEDMKDACKRRLAEIEEENARYQW
jgi:hypothetical protein